MSGLLPSVVGATVPEDGVPFLRFTPAAQKLFDDWHTRHLETVRSPELADAPAFEEHLGMYPKVLPLLALVFHLLGFASGDSPAGPVSEDALRLALDWIGFLEAHARKLYSAELRGDLSAAHVLARRIEAGAVTDRMRVRAIAERAWSGLTRPGAVYAAADVLQSLGWVRVVSEETLGRPASVLRLHSDFRRAKS